MKTWLKLLSCLSWVNFVRHKTSVLQREPNPVLCTRYYKSLAVWIAKPNYVYTNYISLQTPQSLIRRFGQQHLGCWMILLKASLLNNAKLPAMSNEHKTRDFCPPETSKTSKTCSERVRAQWKHDDSQNSRLTWLLLARRGEGVRTCWAAAVTPSSATSQRRAPRRRTACCAPARPAAASGCCGAGRCCWRRWRCHRGSSLWSPRASSSTPCPCPGRWPTCPPLWSHRTGSGCSCTHTQGTC